MTRAKFWALFMLFLVALNTNGSLVKAQGNYDSRYDNQNGDYGASYQDFYDGLAPYGQWISDPMYGYVWLPNVGPDFRPYYTNGYWVMTEYGNTWISNYDWGWAPFHYGRWTFDNYYGWLWIPDTQWAPAWVSWRSNNDYYGWAPMGPGVGINVSLGLIPVDWWIFLSPNYFYEPRFHRYCNNDYNFNRGIYRRTSYVNYTYNDRRNVYYTGPRADDYRRRTGRQTSMFTINNNSRRGVTTVRGNNVNIYRPSMRNIENNAPRKIVQTDRRISTRPQTFGDNKIQPEGRQRVLGQSPVENTRMINSENRTATPNQPAIRNERTERLNERRAEQNRTNNISREQQVQNQRQANFQNEQNRNNVLQEQNNAEVIRQQNEQRRVQQENEQRRMQQENLRQQQLQQRDNQMLQQRNEEMNRQRSLQTEEANRQRMQQMRDAQIERQRAQPAPREQQMSRPFRESQPVQQISRPQQREQMRESRPAIQEQRANPSAPAPANNDRPTERFRNR